MAGNASPMPERENEKRYSYPYAEKDGALPGLIPLLRKRVRTIAMPSLFPPEHGGISVPC